MTAPVPGITPAGVGPAPGQIWAPVDPELLAPLIQACPAVAGLHGGGFGEVATYLPGRRVRGIRVGDDEVEIHVVGRYPARVAEIVAQVRAAAAPLVGGLAVHVFLEDLQLPGEQDPADAVEHDSVRRGSAGPTAPAAPATPDHAGVAAPRFPAPATPQPSTRPQTPSVPPRPPAAGLDTTTETTETRQPKEPSR